MTNAHATEKRNSLTEHCLLSFITFNRNTGFQDHTHIKRLDGICVTSFFLFPSLSLSLFHLLLSQEHLLGLNNDSLGSVARPLSFIKDQFNISNLEREAEEFLNAVLHRKGTSISFV